MEKLEAWTEKDEEKDARQPCVSKQNQNKWMKNF